MSECFFEYEQNIPCHCDDCDWKGLSQDTEMITDVQERVTPGSIAPVGECPECGCFAYYDEEHAPEWTTQGTLWKLKQMLALLNDKVAALTT